MGVPISSEGQKAQFSLRGSKGVSSSAVSGPLAGKWLKKRLCCARGSRLASPGVCGGARLRSAALALRRAASILRNRSEFAPKRRSSLSSSAACLARPGAGLSGVLPPPASATPKKAVSTKALSEVSFGLRRRLCRLRKKAKRGLFRRGTDSAFLRKSQKQCPRQRLFQSVSALQAPLASALRSPFRGESLRVNRRLRPRRRLLRATFPLNWESGRRSRASLRPSEGASQSSACVSPLLRELRALPSAVAGDPRRPRSD